LKSLGKLGVIDGGIQSTNDSGHVGIENEAIEGKGGERIIRRILSGRSPVEE
jgi:hypothetical protein